MESRESGANAVMVRDLVVDTDIKGLNDDAFALHYLIGVGRIPSLVTTVFGNTSPGQSATDARALLQNACGFGAPPVIEGASRPLGWTADRRSQRERLLASLPHDTYLAGLAPSGPLFIGQPEVSGTSQATQALVDHLGSSDASDVLALGPLTNIAEACERLPHAVLAKHRLWVCGGALETGNVTGATEFNAFADSLGLSIALAAPWDKVTLVPLDVTGTVHFGRADVERLLATGSAFGIELAASRASLHHSDPSLHELMWDAVGAVLLAQPHHALREKSTQLFISLDGEHPGQCQVAPDCQATNHKVVFEIDPEAIVNEFARAFERS